MLSFLEERWNIDFEGWEIEKEERVYRFELPLHANLGEAYQVAGEFLDELVSLINKHAESTKKAPEEEKPKEVENVSIQESSKDV